MAVVIVGAVFALPSGAAFSIGRGAESGTAVPDGEVLRLEIAINLARREAGVPPLRLDPDLSELARAHCEDMARRGYFSHVSPEGRTPFDRLTGAGVPWRAAAENLALDRDPESAHEALMASPNHRRNILDPRFRRVGIGIVRTGHGGVLVGQLFAD